MAKRKKPRTPAPPRRPAAPRSSTDGNGAEAQQPARRGRSRRRSVRSGKRRTQTDTDRRNRMILYGLAGAGIVGLVVALLALFVLGKGGTSRHTSTGRGRLRQPARPDAQGAAVAEEHGGPRCARQADRRSDPPDGGREAAHPPAPGHLRDGKHVTVPRPDRDQAQGAGAPSSPSCTPTTRRVIHLESERAQAFSLGQFFGVWGLYLAKNCVGNLCSPPNRFLGLRQREEDPADRRSRQARPRAARRDRDRVRHAAGDDPVEL